MMVMMATHATNELYTAFICCQAPGGCITPRSCWRRAFSSIIFNSLYVAVLVTAFFRFGEPMACGYALAKYSFKAGRPSFVFIMITMMIPPQIGLVGFVTEMKQIGWLGSHLPLIVPPRRPMRSAFMDAPVRPFLYSHRHYGSARIDGCGEFQTFSELSQCVSLR